jgi:hypothetical protein
MYPQDYLVRGWVIDEHSKEVTLAGTPHGLAHIRLDSRLHMQNSSSTAPNLRHAFALFSILPGESIQSFSKLYTLPSYHTSLPDFGAATENGLDYD